MCDQMSGSTSNANVILLFSQLFCKGIDCEDPG